MNFGYQLIMVCHSFFQKKRLYNSILIVHLHPQYHINIAVLTHIVNAKIAQLVERDLAKVEVAGSNPVFRSKNKCFYCDSKNHIYKHSDGEYI